jgi:hypothetical protein
MLFRQVAGTARTARSPNATSNAAFFHDSAVAVSRLQGRLAPFTLRILLYPITLLVVNVVITVSDLLVSKYKGSLPEAVYVLYTVHYILYGGRGIFLALVSGIMR